MTPEEIAEIRDLAERHQSVPAYAVVALCKQLERLTALLEPLRPLEAAATEAPWGYWPGYGISPEPGCTLSLEGDCDEAEPPDDTAFVIAARNALPEMLRVVGS